ncbi:Rieske (2Fe-2S) iron-sulfur domain protein [Desulfarculus baarsii DSM 2075]|uniref:Rieske (2Fe-2S) iron-sulfur domain protein n=1 Tax=Desulfarculus baarsii (strain ATCC 33931 / DSM 2075 / LMG 7858 / VKM B-1802 / 2st14) TaxID=644282 RepID=E1QLG2_DESB2|nr:Rieske (2Fe-2S) protein [Desulfarculus baarsii]ADK86397.1 Rieske (2Fe-2S) iron-sulfur domain protein [Desulfarculus baarsii DSM 2075]
MGVFARVFGLCQTRPPADAGCWSFDRDKVVVDLNRAPELAVSGGAVRLEGGGLPWRVLVFRDQDGVLRAVINRCAHAGRRLDPVAGGQALQCCSLGRSTFDVDGQRLGGPAKGGVRALAAVVDANFLAIDLA